MASPDKITKVLGKVAQGVRLTRAETQIALSAQEAMAIYKNTGGLMAKPASESLIARKPTTSRGTRLASTK